LKQPDILILDEPTSALDRVTEQKIEMMLQHHRQGRTAFVIAHRLSTVVESDLILVLDGGKLVQAGTHEQLRQQPGVYSELSRTQLEWREAPEEERRRGAILAATT
jgi:ABC-type multidrug transport system fused ATPase/permease subunit